MAESRKIVTLLFSDVSGSTSMGEQLDPEALRHVMERYFSEMEAIIDRHGGTVEKFVGDAVMAVFGIPEVHEDDALRAARAAAETRERLAALNDELERARGVKLEVRTGVNTGEVVAGDPRPGQFFATGDAVNVAARLEQAASPGEILLGPLTYRLVRDAVRVEPVEPLELKGKREPVEAWRLLEILPDTPAFTRRIDAPFIGRTQELTALRQAYDRAREDGTCELITITGAPGIGKSRLVRELVASVREEARILVGRCLPYGEGITYWPLVEIVRQVAGGDPRSGLAALLAAERDGALAAERIAAAIGVTDESARTEEIFWAVRVLLERLAREKPLVLVVDDIHWAEPTLLDLVEYLVGFARTPILFLCTARPDLFDVRPHWPRAGSLELRALADAEASALIDALLAEAALAPSVRERIRERAEGNPLFVEQMLALAAENGSEETAVPPTIQALLAARLDGLPPEERAVLVRGAVEGRLFHRGAVSALLPEGERDAVPRHLLTLARKEFVRPDEALFGGDDAFRFAHILVRDAAYEAAPKELRSELHEGFAAWIEDRAADGLPELEEIVGYHLEQSYRHRESLGIVDESVRTLGRRAGEHLAVAGERAFMRGDHRAATNLLERALELLPRGNARRLTLVSPLGESLSEGGRLEDARRLYAYAIDEARSAGSEALALRAEIELNRVTMSTDPEWSGDQALALVERALPVLKAAGDDRGLARAWEAVHDVEWMRGRLAASRAASERALFFAERVGDPQLIANQMKGVVAPSWFGDKSLGDLRPDHQRVLEWARAVGHRAMEGTMLFVLGRIHVEQGRLDEGRPLVDEGLAMLGDLGLVVHSAGLRAQFTWGDLDRDPTGVEERVRSNHELLKSLNETGFLSTQAAYLAMILALRGALEEAELLTYESEQAGNEDDVTTQVAWRFARAMVLARTAQLTEAEALAREALARALVSEYAELTAESHLALADVFRLSGRNEEAASALEDALKIYERKEMTASADAVRAELAELQSGVGSPSQ